MANPLGKMTVKSITSATTNNPRQIPAGLCSHCIPQSHVDSDVWSHFRSRFASQIAIRSSRKITPRGTRVIARFCRSSTVEKGLHIILRNICTFILGLLSKIQFTQLPEKGQVQIYLIVFQHGRLKRRNAHGSPIDARSDPWYHRGPMHEM